MILKKIRANNFLSITGQIEFDLDPRVTVLLGANDHGKSNVLRALLCINEDTPIKDTDTNWDAANDTTLEFEFQLTKEESATLWNAAEADILALPGDHERRQEYSSTPDDEKYHVVARWLFDDLDIRLDNDGGVLFLERDGANAPLTIGTMPFSRISANTLAAIKSIIPRVEMFSNSVGELQDSVNASQIITEPFEFLQGVFFYAGIDPFDAKTAKLFDQNDKTERSLDNASKILDAELRNLWAQGTDLNLHFELRHRHSAIEFLAADPAVKTQKARMSKRSTGVTQFFRLSMILHARRQKHPSNRYIYLFDEPGVFLHPKGQKDLLQVFEQLADDSQIIYATHSLFMLNQNFPERHRLIVRDAEGTKVDQKPYRANWRLATDALGVNLTANILFSPAVLLTEGDSDPIYLYELFRQLNTNGHLDADANMLGIFSYDAEKPNLRFLLQTFKAETSQTKVAALFDGDSMGRGLKKNTKDICDRLNIPQIDLNKSKSIEDYILYPELFLQAVEETIRLASTVENIELPVNLAQQLSERWEAAKDEEGITRGKWFKDASKHFLNGEEASKVALSRIYAFKCRDTDASPSHGVDLENALALCKAIAEKLSMPSIKAKQVIQT